MQTETIMVRRAATVSEADARARLGEKYPGWAVSHFKIEEEDGHRYFVATLDKTAEHPEAGLADVVDAGPDAGPAPDAPEAPEPPKEEKSESSGLEHKMDQVLDMLKTLVHGGDDEPPADDKPLPPPVKEPMGLGAGGPMGMSPFHGKLHMVVARDNSSNVKLATAKAELDTEFGPHGFRVAKMVRRDDKIVAALVRANELPPFLKKDDDDGDDSDKKPEHESDKKDDNPVKGDHWLDKTKKDDDK